MNPVTHTNFSILLDKADAVIAAAEEEVASLTRYRAETVVASFPCSLTAFSGQGDASTPR